MLKVIARAWPSVIDYFHSFAAKYGANLISEKELYIEYTIQQVEITGTEWLGTRIKRCNFTARIEIDCHGGEEVAIQSIFGTIWQISIKGDFYLTSEYNNDKLAAPFYLSASDNVTISFKMADDIMEREMGEFYERYTQQAAKSLLDEFVRDAEKKVNEILDQ